MNNYYKYLPISNEDKRWGLHVLNVGFNRIKKSEAYPSKEHPFHYYFNFKEGRVLDEYQFIYISNGAGFFESKSCSLTKIKAGTVIILYPNEWHRFQPDPAIGWDEYWVGCNGPILKNLQNNFFSKKTPVFYIGIQEDILLLFNDIIKTAKSEKTGYQPLISGATLHMLGVIYYVTRQAIAPPMKYDGAIHQAIEIMRANVNTNISIQDIAAQLTISYSLFRKLFRAYTGIAPHQYFLQLKLDKARILLANQHESIKEIAASLGFDNAFYFSKIFKSQWGKSPKAFRKSLL